MTTMLKTIGIIGRATLTEAEHLQLREMGKAIATLGHTIILIPAKGTATAVREGALSVGGKVIEVKSGVITEADNTLIYRPEGRLITRLEESHPNFMEGNVLIIADAQKLSLWLASVRILIAEEAAK